MSTGAVGASGLVVSTVIDRLPDNIETLPARSTASAVIVCAPSLSTGLVIDQSPVVASAVVTPICVLPSNTRTVLPASAVPVIVGVLSLV